MHSIDFQTRIKDFQARLNDFQVCLNARLNALVGMWSVT